MTVPAPPGERFRRRDEAIDVLARLLATDYAVPLTPALLRLDPTWDPLRDRPRFQALVR